MQLVEDNHGGRYQLSSYDNEGFTINKQKYQHSLLISANHLISDWPPQQHHALRPEHWQWVVEQQPHIVILGVGKTMDFVSPELLMPLHQARIGVEVMPTEAACRTLNILLAENRDVIAALFP